MQEISCHCTLIVPTVGFASALKASGKRSRWFVPQLGHLSTTYGGVREAQWVDRRVAESGMRRHARNSVGASHTIALMLFPEGPVTFRHTPQMADESQFSLAMAVP